MALVIGNGLIWDISLNEKLSPSRNYLTSISKIHKYYGYADAKGQRANYIRGAVAMLIYVSL